MFDGLLDPKVLHQLERLRLATRRPVAGPRHGELRSSRYGASQEFADYREYHPGDDERRIDWYVAARSDEYFVRLYEGEENVRVDFLVDQSASMGFGVPTKLRYARALTAALGLIALSGGHQVQIATFSEGLTSTSTPVTGRRNITRLLQTLTDHAAGGGTDLGAGIAQRLHQDPRPGITFILSDLYDTSGLEEGIKLLRSRGREVCVFHILSSEELHPPQEGAFELVDSETGEELEIALDAATLQLYHDALREWLAKRRSLCTLWNVTYILVDTTKPLDDLLLLRLRKEGILR